MLLFVTNYHPGYGDPNMEGDDTTANMARVVRDDAAPMGYRVVYRGRSYDYACAVPVRNPLVPFVRAPGEPEMGAAFGNDGIFVGLDHFAPAYKGVKGPKSNSVDILATPEAFAAFMARNRNLVKGTGHNGYGYCYIMEAAMASAAPACRAALAQASKRWPGRKKGSDGIMGDASHQARKSDHNQGNAFDLTRDDSKFDMKALSRQVIRDKRTKYVIFNREIWSQANPTWRYYGGASPHDQHMHVSILPEYRNDVSPWVGIAAPDVPKSYDQVWTTIPAGAKAPWTLTAFALANFCKVKSGKFSDGRIAWVCEGRTDRAVKVAREIARRGWTPYSRRVVVGTGSLESLVLAIKAGGPK